MRAALLSVSEDGNVEAIHILSDNDKEAEVVRLALAQWQRTAQLESESAPVVDVRLLNLSMNQGF